jgi:hypothetical protein
MCADDSAATLKVDELLAVSQYSSAELWEGKRLSANGPYGHADEVTRAKDCRSDSGTLYCVALVRRTAASVSSSAFAKPLFAGPLTTSPSAWKREPWHGQSQVFSPLFQ